MYVYCYEDFMNKIFCYNSSEFTQGLIPNNIRIYELHRSPASGAVVSVGIIHGSVVCTQPYDVRIYVSMSVSACINKETQLSVLRVTPGYDAEIASCM